MGKIPVSIISGFLGSGKTTAIIKLLGQKTTNEYWAVIINEFGKVSIDSQTLRSSSSNTGMIFEVSGGCICCSAKGYFQENLKKIVSNRNYTRVIIEPSGLGGIDMVSEIVNANSALCLMPVICLVDMGSIENPRLLINPIYRMQIGKASLIGFSKCDLITDSSLMEQQINKFNSLFPGKRCLKVTDTTFWQVLLYMHSRLSTEENKYTMISADEPKLSDRIYKQKVYTFGCDTVFDSEKLIRFFRCHPQILRAKGHLKTENGWNLVNFTLSGCMFELCEAKEQNELVIIAEKSDISLFEDIDFELRKACF